VICSPVRNLTKNTIAMLADCNFIGRSENVLITGASGCGKSYLACAIGNQACLMGTQNTLPEHESIHRENWSVKT
jgi:DNA replication protein DnaC